MICKYCGGYIPDGAKFCPECGAKADPADAGQQAQGTASSGFDVEKNSKGTVGGFDADSGTRDGSGNAQAGYGRSTQSGYGQNAGYGQSAPGGYGQGAQNGYGQGTQNGYGQGAPNGYDQNIQNGYGQNTQNGYGQGAQNGYGQNTQNGYGQGAQNGYGQSAPNGYGQNPGYGTPNGGSYPNNYGGPKPTYNYGAPAGKDYTKLGGWLLFMVIIDIIAAIAGLIMGLASFGTAASYGEYASWGLGDLVAYTVFAGVVSLVAAVLEIWMAATIIKKSVNIIRVYQIVWLTSLALTIVLLVWIIALNSKYSYLGVDLSSDISTSITEVIFSVLWFIIWNMYFVRSVRVRNYIGNEEYLNRALIKFK